MERKVRSLVGWLDRDEAITGLLGRLPSQNEDTSAQHQQWEAKKAMVMQRPPYTLSLPTIGELPDAIAEKARAFLQRQDVQQTFHRHSNGSLES